MKLPTRFGLLATLLLATTAIPARADLTLIQELEKPGHGEKVVLETKIKGTKVRTDMSEQASAILDTTTGDSVTLIHKQKMAMRVPAAMAKLAEQKILGDRADQEPPRPKPTGKKETINGFPCEEFVTEANGAKISIWATPANEQMKEVTAQLTKISSKMNPFGEFFTGEGFDGFPIRTVVTTDNGLTTKMTLISLRSDELSDKEFEVPDDYREVAMPAMGQ